jgi:hypothetical protein
MRDSISSPVKWKLQGSSLKTNFATFLEELNKTVKNINHNSTIGLNYKILCLKYGTAMASFSVYKNKRTSNVSANKTQKQNIIGQ